MLDYVDCLFNIVTVNAVLYNLTCTVEDKLIILVDSIKHDFNLI